MLTSIKRVSELHISLTSSPILKGDIYSLFHFSFAPEYVVDTRNPEQQDAMLFLSVTSLRLQWQWRRRNASVPGL